ncbi:MAG TPA: serine/threonine-protein kinase [Polyangiaceae bacterium]|nr:serine/threonine-protein kinase [Polyangiaceae bacterium]
MNATGLIETSSIRRAYRRLFELGRGGMARVYLAESLASGVRKLVVLKILNPELCANPEMRASFRREAELSAQMNHPNVVQVLEVVEYAETPVIVMEYLDGASLSALLKYAGKHLSLRLRMHILAQVLAGLHHFHELQDLDGTPLNTVHRDVSPQNIMILHDGPVKVLDFGIAKVNAPDNQVTRTGLIKGKIHYMPPEQLLGEAGLDRRADVFAVGVLLWEAAAGRRMWEGKTEADVLRCMITGELPKVEDFAQDVPESVLQIVRRATHIDRTQRFSSAQDMQVAIERGLAELGWAVQQRDLEEFMACHLGDRRRAHDLKVRDALRTPTSSDVMMYCTPVTQGWAGPESGVDPSRITAAGSERAVSRVFRTSRRSWGWALGLLGALALLGAWLARREVRPAQGSLASPSTAPVHPESVELEVEASPPNAEIYLDGERLGVGRYSGSRRFAPPKAVLEVSAPGYAKERKELSLVRDTALQIVLKPELSVQSTPVFAASADPVTGDKTESPTRSAGPRTRRPGGSTSARGSRGCNPPYTFSADGVKTYKPECF